MKIIKRDGRKVEFNPQKIEQAILKAFICASDKSLATIQGTSSSPNFLEANKYMNEHIYYMELYYREYKPLKGFCYELSEKREHGKQILFKR